MALTPVSCMTVAVYALLLESCRGPLLVEAAKHSLVASGLTRVSFTVTITVTRIHESEPETGPESRSESVTSTAARESESVAGA